MEGNKENNTNIDNFLKIKGLMEFSERTYYLLMILRRKKDPGNSGMTEESHRVYMKFITMKNRLDFLEPEIKIICQALGARCYIDLNPRDYRIFATELSKKLIDRLGKEEYQGLHRLQYQIASSEETINTKLVSVPGRRWMFDVDTEEGYNNLQEWLKEHKIIPIDTLKTSSGYHVIISSFNIREHGIRFEKEIFPGVTLKPGCLVLAYK